MSVGPGTANPPPRPAAGRLYPRRARTRRRDPQRLLGARQLPGERGRSSDGTLKAGPEPRATQPCPQSELLAPAVGPAPGPAVAARRGLPWRPAAALSEPAAAAALCSPPLPRSQPAPRCHPRQRRTPARVRPATAAAPRLPSPGLPAHGDGGGGGGAVPSLDGGRHSAPQRPGRREARREAAARRPSCPPPGCGAPWRPEGAAAERTAPRSGQERNGQLPAAPVTATARAKASAPSLLPCPGGIPGVKGPPRTTTPVPSQDKAPRKGVTNILLIKNNRFGNKHQIELCTRTEIKRDYKGFTS